MSVDLTPDRPVCTQEAACAAGLDVAPSPEELRIMAELIVASWGDRSVEPEDLVASTAEAGAQLARAVPLVLAELNRLRARVAELETSSAPRLCVCGHSRHAHTVPAPHSCFAFGQTCPCPTYRQLLTDAAWEQQKKNIAAREARVAAENEANLAELEAMRRQHPAPCRVPDSPDCTCPAEKDTTTPHQFRQQAEAQVAELGETLKQIRHLHKDSPMGPCPTCFDSDDHAAGGDGLVSYPCPTARLAGAQECNPTPREARHG